MATKQKSPLRLARMRAGYNLTEASILLGISKQYLSAMELGYDRISHTHLSAMRELYGENNG